MLKKLTQSQLDRLRGATKAEGCQIKYMLMRVTDTCESSCNSGTGDGGEKEVRYTVWVCAKAEKRISVCMWAKQLGVPCLQSQDIFPTKEMSENERKHSAAYDLAMREAKDQEGWDYEEYEGTGGAQNKTKHDTPLGDTAQGESTETTPAPPPQPEAAQDEGTIDEKLLYYVSVQRRFDDGADLCTRSARHVWAILVTRSAGYSAERKWKVNRKTAIMTLAKGMQTHVMANQEWKDYAQKQLDRAGLTLPSATPVKKVTGAQGDAAEDSGPSTKRQKCGGDVGAAAVGVDKRTSAALEAINEQLLSYLLNQRTFDDGEELSTRAPSDVWTHLQICADRWYTQKKLEPCVDTHRPTLVKAMRTHSMGDEGWRGYALGRL